MAPLTSFVTFHASNMLLNVTYCCLVYNRYISPAYIARIVVIIYMRCTFLCRFAVCNTFAPLPTYDLLAMCTSVLANHEAALAYTIGITRSVVLVSQASGSLIL